jgi:S1-C subfamily serine protease
MSTVDRRFVMNKVLASVSEELAALVASVPGIVRVEGRKRMAASGVSWAEDGVLVTADHVVRQEAPIRIGLPDGETGQASLVGRDPSTDLAVLRLNSGGLPSPAWRATDDLKVGHLGLAIGRPGRSVQSTFGIVSAVGGSYQTSVGGSVDRYLQTDAVMYPGFSGGALVTADGRVAGLMTSALLRGVSLAIPTETVRRVVETLLKHGRIRRGFLGVGVQPVHMPEIAARGSGQLDGLLVMSVEPGSPADQAGLMLGDALLTIDGIRLESIETLFGALSGDRVGKAVEIRLLRGGEVKSVQATIGERDEPISAGSGGR